MAYRPKRIEQGRNALRFDICRSDGSTKSVVLNQAVVKVGTLSSSGLLIDDDDTVSRMHAIIEVESPSHVSVVDLCSVHGTYVNDVKVSKAQVQMGDEVRFGDTRVTVRRADSPDAETNPGHQASKPDRMNFTECLDWAAENEATLRFSGLVVFAWQETGTVVVKGGSLKDAINLLRAYTARDEASKSS